jgi:hypothetical protein
LIGIDGAGSEGGSVSAPSGAGSGAGSGTGNSGGGGGSGGAGTPAPGELGAPYARLTRAEYRATIEAAFGVDAPVSGIPDDGRIGPFTSNVASLDPAHEFLLASEDLAAQIVPSTLPACSGASAASCVAASYQAPLERLYRRTLSSTELEKLAELVTSLEASGVSAEDATRAMVVSALMSADFLFRATPLSGDPARARRLVEHLSYALWDAPPDSELVTASLNGATDLAPALKEQALRLGADARSVPVLARFLAQWLHVDVDSKLGDNSHDFAASPLYAELLAFAGHALASNISVKSFVNGTHGFIQRENFAAYGMAPVSAAEDVVAVSWEGSSRRGLLSEELFLDATRHPIPSRRPIFRGRLVRSSLLCEPIASPPANVVDLDAEVSDRTTDVRCAGCHLLMDPIGKAFATLDLDNTLSAPPAVVTGSGEISGEYADLPTLLDAIAESQTYADCFSRNLLGFFLEQDPEHVDAAAVGDVSAVVKAGGGLAEALAQVVASLDERSRTAVPWCTGE